MKRVAFAFFAATALFGAALRSHAESPVANLETFASEIRPLLDKHCAGCHGSQESKAELRVDQLDPDLFQGNDAEHWEEVYNQLNAGEMPPADQPQPTLEERERITIWLNDQLRAAAAMRRSTSGSNVIRRLTRYEYNNTLRDLLGLELDFAKDLPPEGAAKEGFVNNSLVLGTSGLHLEYFQRIAASAIRKAISPGDQPEPFVLEVQPENHLAKPVADIGQVKKKKRRAPKGPVVVVGSLAADGGVLLRPSTPDRKGSKKANAGGDLLQLNLNALPQEGPIRVTIRAAAVDPTEQAKPRLHIELGYDGGNSASPYEVLASQDISNAEHAEYVFEVRGENFPLTTLNAKSRQFLKVRNAFHPGTSELLPESFPGLLVDSIKVEGRCYDVWPPNTRSRILGVSKHPKGSVMACREILAAFMKRAYRRPVSESEVDRMFALFETLRSRDLGYEDAIIETLSAVLSSPGFLLLAEPAPVGEEPDSPRPLNDYELASRLSYFLWSSMPDETLFKLADSGSLSRSNVLAAQVERMLADEKSEAFFEHFASQWLHLDGIYSVAINPEFFPSFNEEFKGTMAAETVAFFAELVKGNRSALELIDSDYAMLNAELAAHYGVGGVAGHSLRSVKLTPSNRRGGILTHASLLTLNSSGDDTHPIKRGVWLLERLLGDPPPPPPPAVPTLAEGDNNGEQLSLKDRLLAHRQQEACVTCHRKIDPWGLAFENYDGIGVWRDSTPGEEPVLVDAPKKIRPSANAPVFPKQPAVAAPQIDQLDDAGERVKELVEAVNETLVSLQRPYNHLRRLGSAGAGDQLRRFLSYIEDRQPKVESAIDKLLIESGRNRKDFMKEFRARNASVLASNQEIRTRAEAMAPAKGEAKSRRNPKRKRTMRGSVDPQTTLADGTDIPNLDALKAYLLEHKRDQFSETVVRKVMGYALGRYLDFTDTETVNALNKQFAANEYRLQDLVKSVVLSQPFLTK